MAEYISREAMVKNLTADLEHHSGEGDPRTHLVIQRFIKYVEDFPSSDVQPVKHGRWLNHHAIWIGQPEIEGWFVQAKCSKCEKWAHVMNPYTKSVDYELCPHCGTRMDGDTECQDTE